MTLAKTLLSLGKVAEAEAMIRDTFEQSVKVRAMLDMHSGVCS